MKRLRRIEIIAFRRRTIVVGENERSAGTSAVLDEEVRVALSQLSAAGGGAAKADAVSIAGNERTASKNRLSQITRRALGRIGTRLNLLRHARSNIYGGQDEH